MKLRQSQDGKDQMNELEIRARRNRLLRSSASTSKLTQICAIGLGGSGALLNQLPEILPDAADHVLVADSDLKILEDCPRIADCIQLSADGVIAGILENRENYSLLRDGQMSNVQTAFETDQGVGKVRAVATVVLGYNLDTVKARVQNVLTRILRKYQGPHPKRLIVHLVFSLCGGSGSALAIPFAALLIDAARRMAPTLQVVVIGHCLAPSLFLDKIMTPADRQRTLANAAVTLLELKYVQQPENTRQLALALDIPSIERPQFEHLAYYDLTDSGCRAQSLEVIDALILANVAATASQPLQALEAARNLNPTTAQQGTSADELGTSVIETRHTEIIKAPVDKLQNLYVAKVLWGKLASASAAPEHEHVRIANERCLPELGLEAAQRQAVEQLRPDERYQLPASISSFSNTQAAAVCLKSRQLWIKLGRPELQRKSAAVARQLEQLASARAGSYVDSVAKEVANLGEYTAAIREAVHQLAERRTANQREQEALAATDCHTQLDAAVNRLRSVAFGRWRQGPRLQLQRRLAAALDAEARDFVLHAYRGYLDRQLELLREQAANGGTS